MAEFRRVFRVQGMDTDANPRFQMVPNGGCRFVALHGGAGWAVVSGNPAICSITEIPETALPVDDRATGPNAAARGDRFFRLSGNAKGVAFIGAANATGSSLALEVGVKDKLTQRIHFYSVVDSTGRRAHRPLAEVGQWIPSLNYIYKRQANIEVVRHGALERLTVPHDLGDPIMLGASGLGTNGQRIAACGDQTSDLNVYLVWEIQRPGAGWDTDATTGEIGSAHKGTGHGTVIFEDSAGPDNMLSMAHELGHHLGLEHREVQKVDLMWPITGERGLNLSKADVNIANP